MKWRCGLTSKLAGWAGMEIDMDRIEYILKNIYNFFSIAVRIMDNNGKIIWMPFEGFDKMDPVCCNSELWEAVYESGRKEEEKYILHDDYTDVLTIPTF